MRTALAIVLLAIAAPLPAGERCAKSASNRIEITAQALSAKPLASRVEADRPRKVIMLSAWQRAFLFDPQIL